MTHPFYPNGWQVIVLTTSMHCVPFDDLKPHYMDQDGTCWCHPTEDNERADFWGHHSMDGREAYEDGRLLN